MNRPITNHGTRAGYRAHRRRGQTACADCRLANAAYTASRAGRDRVRLNTDELVAEVTHLIGTDTADSIARRLGYTTLDNLMTRLRRDGHQHLVNRLAGRTDPVDAAA